MGVDQTNLKIGLTPNSSAGGRREDLSQLELAEELEVEDELENSIFLLIVIVKIITSLSIYTTKRNEGKETF